MTKRPSSLHVLWVAPLTACVALPVYAQAPDEGFALEEIVVTARKREENLQDVPLAVTALSAETLQREGIKSIEGITERDPSLSFDLGIAPYDTRIVVRGLSPTRGRPNVATLIDGIDVSSEAIGVAGGSLLINPRLVDIERIEIVKGPQSALYGRSAFAGAISYITADPADTVSGSVELEGAQYNQYQVKSSLSLPLTETLGMRINGYKFDERGIYRNQGRDGGGEFVGGGDGMGGSLTIKWQPTDTYSLKFRTEFSDDNFAQPAQATVPFNSIAQVPASASSCRTYSIANPAGGTPLVATGPVLDASCQFLDANANLPANTRNLVRIYEQAAGNLGFYDDMSVPAFRGRMLRGRDLRVTYNPDYTKSLDNGLTAPAFPGTTREVLRFSAVQNFETSFGTFTSLSGYTSSQVDTDLDFDKTDHLTTMQTIKTFSKTNQFNQELRFTSDFDGPLQFISGVQFWRERADQDDGNNTVFGRGSACPLGSGPPFAAPGQFACAGNSNIVPVFARYVYTETSVAPFMDDVGRARELSRVTRNVDHLSYYLEFEWDVTDTLRFIGEARYVDEDNEVFGPVTAGSQGPGTVILCGAFGDCRQSASIPYPAAPGLPGSFAGLGFIAPPIVYSGYERNDKYWTPKATVQWQPADNLNLYGSYSIGKKPGGLGTLTIGAFGLPGRSDIEFEPERIKVYEVGAKWTSADRRLQVNGAAFYQDFTDKQVSTQVIIGTTLGNRITNAGGAELQGLELSTLWRASEFLTVSAGVTHFLKYEFTDYETLSGGAAEIARTGTCTPVTTVVIESGVNKARTTCLVSRTGNKIEDTPETAAAVSLGYRRPFGDAARYWFADLDGSYTGKRFIEDDNTVFLEAYTNVDFRLGIGTDRWSALLFIDNVLDNNKVTSAGSGPGNVFADVRLNQNIGAVNALIPPNLRSPFGASPLGLAIPTQIFANLPNPRVIGMRIAYKF